MAQANFLKGETCEQCRGPILAEPCQVETFDEESWDYIVQVYWPCYQCGHLNPCGSVPHYSF